MLSYVISVLVVRSQFGIVCTKLRQQEYLGVEYRLARIMLPSKGGKSSEDKSSYRRDMVGVSLYCNGSSLGSNPDITPKYKVGDISKGVANTL
jgi:hypothetical protein